MFNIIKYFKKIFRIKSIYDDVQVIDYGNRRVYKIPIDNLSKKEALDSLKKLLGQYNYKFDFNYFIKKDRFDKIKKLRSLY